MSSAAPARLTLGPASMIEVRSATKYQTMIVPNSTLHRAQKAGATQCHITQKTKIKSAKSSRLGSCMP